MKNMTKRRIIAFLLLSAMLLVTAISGEFLLVNADHAGHNDGSCEVCRSMLYARGVLFSFTLVAPVLAILILSVLYELFSAHSLGCVTGINGTPVILRVRLNN